jgi:hypothetical protein
MKTDVIGRLASAVALTLLVTAAASAQQQGRRFGGGAFQGGVGILQRTEVQTELKLTDAQKTQVSQMFEQRRGQGGGQRGQGNASFEERQKRLAERMAEDMKQVNAILNADQQKRFKEIWLQQQGLPALAYPSVASELKLSDEQHSKVMSILSEQAQAQRPRGQGGGGDFAALRERMLAMRRETNSKIEAVLTDAQKAEWKTMLGAAFDLPPAAPRRPRNQN